MQVVPHAWPFTFPPPSQSWQLQYGFTVPPLPNTTTWDYRRQVFYIWGDVSFDEYGLEGGSNQISTYLYNQIVPQLILGWGGTHDPSGGFEYIGQPQSPTWILQADYYWQDKEGTSYQLAGKNINVMPGERLNETISYNASTGSITATIGVSGAGPSRTSTIYSTRPFPDSSPPLFSSWRDFFTRAAAKSGTSGPMGSPVFNVETHNVNSATMCSVLPMAIGSMRLPGVSWSTGKYYVAQNGDFKCHGSAQALAKASFGAFDTWAG